MYPGQEYWHRLNPNIRRAEENWVKNRGPAEGVAVVHKTDSSIRFLEIPPIPREALEFIEQAQKEAEKLTFDK
jgi:hypothetical protein